MLASTGSNPERRRCLKSPQATCPGGTMPDEYLLRLEASGEVTRAQTDAIEPQPEEAEE